MRFSFPAHVALLNEFLIHRRAIAERIENTLLNVRGKATSGSRDRSHFERLLQRAFFALPGLPTALASLKGELRVMHLSDGFEPVQLDRFANEFDPLELVVRAYEYWDGHRWPGSAGRLAYAQTLYAVFMLRQFESLSLRVWDDGNEGAGDRLDDIQRLLDRLNDPALAPVFVRDARWLIQTAQSPFTRHLHPYLHVASRVSSAFTGVVRLGIHEAGAKLAGGHLRSQLRYRVRATQRPLEDPENLAFTRNSNALDGALLIRDLVPLLDAYAIACEQGRHEDRLNLADAVLQGISADPELLLVRLDLLTPCTMIEDLFIEPGPDGHPRYTAWGEAHTTLLARYRHLVAALAGSLKADLVEMDPARQVYSPYGITYGFCADLLSNMAMDSLPSHPSRGITLEDVFNSRGRLDDTLARAVGWARLPRRSGEQAHFDHSPEYGAENAARLITALEARVRAGSNLNGSHVPDGRLFVVPRSASSASSSARAVPTDHVLADEYCFTTDAARAVSTGATAWPKAQVVQDRREGRYLASVESDGTWVAISKVILTLITSQGRHAVITDVPRSIIEILHLTCPGLVAPLPNEG